MTRLPHDEARSDLWIGNIGNRCQKAPDVNVIRSVSQKRLVNQQELVLDPLND